MKKLWNKTRSRSRRQSETRPTTVKSSPSKEQLATPPVPALPRTSQSMQRTIGTVHDGRIRPVLVGVSRPGEFASRPGTAGSLQNAVSLAADRSSLEFARGHTRTKSPRYVDIFSASRTRSITSSAYNEEVAIRNMDFQMTRVEQQRDYIPSSKYQEEVALRNSYRSSSEAPRTSADRNHRSWISSGTESGPSRGHTPHHSWSKTIQDLPPSASASKVASSDQPLPTVLDEPSPLPAAVNEMEDPFATMSGESGVSTGQMGAVNARLAGYNLSRSEVSQPRPADHLTTRSSSRMSATSSHTPVINLAHRTIMDLTGSDDEVEPPHSPPNRSAKAGAQATVPVQSAKSQQHLHQHQQPATLVEKQYEIPRNETRPEPEDSRSPPVQVVTQIEPPKMVEPKPKQHASSFSTISTWASSAPAIEPAAPVPTPSKVQAVPRRDHVAAQLASVAAANRLSTVNETETDVEDGTGELSTPTSPEPVLRTNKPAVFNGAGKTSSTALAAATAATPEKGSESRQAEHVFTSPESLQPADFTSPSDAFGVRTRDFAINPSKLNARVEREANTKAKVSKASPATNDAESVGFVTNGETSFDEEAFRRKQEQARAALIKLQQSLNEDFLPPPREQPAARPNRMNGVGQRKVPASRTVSDPHGPVAPSSIFAKNRDQGVNGSDSYDSGEAPAPTVPIYATRPALNPHASGSSSSTVQANARVANRQPLQQSQPNVPPRNRSADKTGKGKGKGKEREIDIALFNLQQAAAELGGPPPRASSAHGRYVHSSLSERRAGSAAGAYDRGANGYGPGHVDVKRPYTSAAQNGHIPPSPGDVSLSNFPVAPYPHQYQRDAASPAPGVPQSPLRGYGHHSSEHITERDFATERLKRRGSTASQASQMTSTSQYSIPFHMIPERGSSMRDIMVKEEGE